MRAASVRPVSDCADPGYVLCCPDKFRGALTAPEAAVALASGVRSAGLAAVEHALADGGEGTVAAVAASTGADVNTVVVTGPLGAPVEAEIAMLPNGDAVTELASAAGFAAVAGSPDVMAASTAGVGELVLQAFGHGARRVVLGLGGSATVDGGLGALRALGAVLYDMDGQPLRGCGADLMRLGRIDTSGIPWRLRGSLILAADVASPLTGPTGAAHMFAPQKGATPAEVEALEKGLARLGELFGSDVQRQPGMGAAGGFPVPFAALLGAQIRSGAALVQQLTGFRAALGGASACITGEGKVDAQTLAGKVVERVVDEARREGVPAFVVAGAVEPESASLYRNGAAAVLPIGRSARTLADALTETEQDLEWVGGAIGNMLLACGEPTQAADRRPLLLQQA